MQIARGQKTGGRDFKPGQSGNPKGPPKLSPDVKAARKINRLEFERVATEMLNKTADEIKATAKDPQTRGLELIVSTILMKGIQNGDQFRLNFFLERLIGKVSDKVQHSFPKRTVIERHGGGEVILGAKPEEE